MKKILLFIFLLTITIPCFSFIQPVKDAVNIIEAYSDKYILNEVYKYELIELREEQKVERIHLAYQYKLKRTKIKNQHKREIKKKNKIIENICNKYKNLDFNIYDGLKDLIKLISVYNKPYVSSTSMNNS